MSSDLTKASEMPDTVNKDEAPDMTQPGDASVVAPEGETSFGPRNSKGWDGKLRVPKTAVLANPEALSDPEYSDEDNIMDGEEISPDEGTYSCRLPTLMRVLCQG